MLAQLSPLFVYHVVMYSLYRVVVAREEHVTLGASVMKILQGVNVVCG